MCPETVTVQRNLPQSGTRLHIRLSVIMRAHAMLCPAQAMCQAMCQAMTRATTWVGQILTKSLTMLRLQWQLQWQLQLQLQLQLRLNLFFYRDAANSSAYLLPYDSYNLFDCQHKSIPAILGVKIDVNGTNRNSDKPLLKRRKFVDFKP